MELLTQNEIEALVGKNLDNVVGQEVIDNIVETEKISETEKRVTECSDIPELEGSFYYQGKVRANFYGGKLATKDNLPLRVLVTTGNISTHDKVRGVIPFKDQITSELSNFMFELISDTLPNSQIVASGIVAVSEQCSPIDFEMVLRRYMAKSSTETSLYHHYANLGEREFCSHKLPEGLVANGRLPFLIDTPSTKARDSGHDISVPPQYLFDNGIVSSEDYELIKNATMNAFVRAEEFLITKGIILVDTKFELGRGKNGKIEYTDEALTLDASRYWLALDYDEKFLKGEDPTSYSKELARGLGKPGEPFTDEHRFKIACRYIETYQLLTGKKFEPDTRDARQKIIEDTNNCLEQVMRR